MGRPCGDSRGAGLFPLCVCWPPLFFAEEVALLLLVVTTFAGLSLLVHERQLVTVDVLAQWLGPRSIRLLARAIDLAVLILAAAMAVVAYRYVATPLCLVREVDHVGDAARGGAGLLLPWR